MGNQCLQLSNEFGSTAVGMSEDCLTLNVYVPVSFFTGERVLSDYLKKKLPFISPTGQQHYEKLVHGGGGRVRVEGRIGNEEKGTVSLYTITPIYNQFHSTQ